MAIALHVDKRDSDFKVRVRHTFYGETLAECYQLRDQHAGGCQAFGPALEREEIIEETEEIGEVPTWEYD